MGRYLELQPLLSALEVPSNHRTYTNRHNTNHEIKQDQRATTNQYRTQRTIHKRRKHPTVPSVSADHNVLSIQRSDTCDRLAFHCIVISNRRDVPATRHDCDLKQHKAEDSNAKRRDCQATRLWCSLDRATNVICWSRNNTTNAKVSKQKPPTEVRLWGQR